jgi:hypothetical protein
MRKKEIIWATNVGGMTSPKELRIPVRYHVIVRKVPFRLDIVLKQYLTVGDGFAPLGESHHRVGSTLYFLVFICPQMIVVSAIRCRLVDAGLVSIP